METNGLLSGNCVTGYKSQDEETATVVCLALKKVDS